MSLILGIIVLGLSLFYIFNEYFAEDELDWEACRQSVVLRNVMPESERPLIDVLTNYKEEFPLKCKNSVVGVKYEDNFPETTHKENQERISKEIIDLMQQCWYLVGEGEFDLFSVNFAKEKKSCLICSRVHFNEASKYLLRTPDGLHLGRYILSHDLDGKEIPEDKWHLKKDSNKGTYMVVGGSYAKYFSFELKENKFKVPFKFKANFSFLTTDNLDKKDAFGYRGDYGLREEIEPEKGDLLIGVYFYSNREWFENIGATKYRFSYPFYAQVGVDDLDCDIESIPA